MSEEKNQKMLSEIKSQIQRGYLYLDKEKDGEKLELLGRAIRSFILMEQYAWERDVAVSQLESLGLSLGEKTDAVKQAVQFKKYFDELYGAGLEVAYWHQNGDLEPFDTFYESALEYNDTKKELKEERKTIFEELAETIAYLMTIERGYDWGCKGFADCLKKAKEMIRKDDDFIIGFCIGLRFTAAPKTERYDIATKVIEMMQQYRYAEKDVMVRLVTTEEYLSLKEDDVIYENTEGRTFHKGVVLASAVRNTGTGECTKIYTSLGYLSAKSVWVEAFVEEEE